MKRAEIKFEGVAPPQPAAGCQELGMAAEELGITYGVPNGTGTSSWELSPGEIQVVERMDGVIEVHDPSFEQPFRFGDQSLIKDPVTDRVVVEIWNYYTYLMSARQVGVTERTALLAGSGRMSRMPHMLSCTALAVRFGCSPREILAMTAHDVGHRIKCHENDKVIQQAGPHTAHDFDVPGFLHRSGFVDRLRAKGLCDAQGMLANGVHINELGIGKDEPPSILSHRSQTYFPDLDRMGYNLMQQAVTPGGVAFARAHLADLVRIPDSPFGDQLVFQTSEHARDFSLGQIMRWIRGWASRENLTLGQLSQMMTRYVLTSNHPEAEPYQTHFPGDTLRGLEEDWQNTVQVIAYRDPAVSGLLKLIDRLVNFTRYYDAEIRNGTLEYSGPRFPPDMTMYEHPHKLSDTSPHVRGDYLVLWVPPGKRRLVNAVMNNGGQLVRTHEAMPDLAALVKRHEAWAVGSFCVVTDLAHSRSGLSRIERAALRHMVGPEARARWQKALLREPMAQDELAAHIATQNERYRHIGALPASALATSVV
jgi:hypothetical protein